MKCLKFPAKDCDLLTCQTKGKCLWHDELTSTQKEPEAVHGNEVEKEVCEVAGNNFLSANKNECMVKVRTYKGVTLNDEYCALLIENSEFHHKVRARLARYDTKEWTDLQSRLLKMELEFSAEEIIAHAEYLFPKVGMPDEA